MVWRELDDFSGDSVCLVLSSHPHDDADYHREYAACLDAMGQGS